jgi:membrane-associated protein
VEEGVLPGDLEAILKAIGLLGIYAMIFAESGLLVGIFLPGDSVLFTAGVLAAEGFFSFPALMIGSFIAAVTGDAVGYWFGRRVGRRLYERPDSRWFKQAHLDKAERFYAQHGGKAIVLARFLPVVRTLAPIVAGISAMQYRRFAFFNVIGGVLWAIGLTTAGYVLGRSVPHIDRYLLPIIALIIVVSALPTLIHVWRDHRHEIMTAVRQRLSKRRPAAGSREPEAERR